MIAAPTRFPTDATYASWPRLQRDLWRDTGENGVPAEVDRWIAALDMIRDSIWNPADHDG